MAPAILWSSGFAVASVCVTVGCQSPTNETTTTTKANQDKDNIAYYCRQQRCSSDHDGAFLGRDTLDEAK